MTSHHQPFLPLLLLLQFVQTPLVLCGPQESLLWTTTANSFSTNYIPPTRSLTCRTNDTASVKQDEDQDDGDEIMFFDEWIEDDRACWPVDTSWYTEQDFFLNSAVCYVEEDFLDWEDDEEWDDDGDEEEEWDEEDDSLPPLPIPLAETPISPQEEEQILNEIFTEWIHWVHPHDDLQLDMPHDLAQEYQTYEQQPNFLVPKQLQAGEVDDIRWRDTGDIIGDDEIFVVGLDPQLLQAFQTYFETAGLLDIVQQFLYPNTTSVPPNNNETNNQLWTLNDGHKWSAKRANHWRTDMVWFDPADEACYERLRHILRKGHFQTVLEAVADHLQLPNLTVHGLGAIFVGKFQASIDRFQIHRDVPGTRGAFYNILVPIYLPSNGDHASLYIGGKDDHLCAPIVLKPHMATIIGSDSWHGTGECDYSSNQEFRLSMSIWVSEITPATLPVITTDDLSPWPLHNDTAWYQAQARRNLTLQDAGRGPFLQVRDQRTDCAQVQHRCDTDWEKVRAKCAKTCGVYMGTEEYQANLEALKLL